MVLSAIPRSSLHEVTQAEPAAYGSLRYLASLSIVEFINSFHVSIESLSTDQLEYFLVARALLPLAGSLGIPEARSSGDGQAPLHIKTDTEIAKERHVDRESARSRVPSRNFTIGTAELRDLPHILAHQRCYPRQQLVYMLANGQLTRQVMLHEGEAPEETEELTYESRQQPFTGEECDPSQRAYVLLDVSQSMNGLIPLGGTRPDKRGIIARGLSLSFLCVAEAQRSLLHFRPFSSSVGTRISAAQPTDLASIIDEVFSLRNGGSTALQSALDEAAKDLEAVSKDARVDVMLITDGLSRLSANSLEGRHLHTFVVGGFLNDQTGCEKVLENLTKWSTTFHQIKGASSAELLKPRACDIKAFYDLLKQALEQAPHVRTSSELEKAINLIALGRACLALSENDSEMDASQERLRSLLEETSRALSSPELKHEVSEREREFQRMCAVYDKQLPAGFRGQSSGLDSMKEEKNPHISIRRGGNGSPHRDGLLLLCKALYRRCKEWLFSFLENRQ